MTLYMIGIGLNDEKDITVKGLEAVRGCERIYLENYTSRLSCSVEELENFYGKRIVEADRDLVEQQAEQTILKDAQKVNTAFLVIGDALSATTHIDLVKRAKELGISVEIIHNATVLNAVSMTGLQLYKFGKTTSIPFPDENPDVITPYDVIEQNKSIGAHTLLLLDLKPSENKFLAIKEAIRFLLSIEQKKKKGVFTADTLCIGCSNLGGKNIIKAGKAAKIASYGFTEPPFCIIVPGKMHFMEEDFLKDFLI